MKPTTLIGSACLALGTLLPAAGWAQDDTRGPASAARDDRSVSFIATPVDESKLAGYRGGTDVVQNDMRLSGTTADNSARNVTTGDNSIASGSFANMNGLPVVIQNSGANVLIQNAVILHLQMN